MTCSMTHRSEPRFFSLNPQSGPKCGPNPHRKCGDIPSSGAKEMSPAGKEWRLWVTEMPVSVSSRRGSAPNVLKCGPSPRPKCVPIRVTEDREWTRLAMEIPTLGRSRSAGRPHSAAEVGESLTPRPKFSYSPPSWLPELPRIMDLSGLRVLCAPGPCLRISDSGPGRILVPHKSFE
jgi:hypothetical protein